MPKNTKERTRSFKVQTDFNGIPFIRFGGKYLANELGLVYGDRLEFSSNGNTIILRKYTALELEQYETARHEKAWLKKLFISRNKRKSTAMILAKSHGIYGVDDEFYKQHEKNLGAETQ